MRILLDTNAYTALMANRGGVAERVRRAERVLVSSIVLGELNFGFRNGSRYRRNREQLESFLAKRFVELLPVAIGTAERFGMIATRLRHRGTPIPTNDVWIAAHAMESGGELLSYDGHFERVEGLFWTRLSDG